MLQVCIKYSMCDLICDVVSCCVWSWDVRKSNVYDKIMIENRKKRKYGNQRNFYVNLYQLDLASLLWIPFLYRLSRADARGTAGSIYRVPHIATL